MTLEEAILHTEEVARSSECKKCKEEHEQLRNWLEELKSMKNNEGKKLASFGEAIEAVKGGKTAKRIGWNGKNQYIEIARNISYKNASGERVNAEHKNIGNQAIAFVGTSGVQIGWLASQADMLADDWVIGGGLD